MTDLAEVKRLIRGNPQARWCPQGVHQIRSVSSSPTPNRGVSSRIDCERGHPLGPDCRKPCARCGIATPD